MQNAGKKQVERPQSQWRKSFKTWRANTARLNPPARLIIPEEAVLAPAAYCLAAELKNIPVIMVTADSKAAEELAEAVENYSALLNEAKAILRIPEIKGLRRDWIPENEAAMCAALEAAASRRDMIFIASAAALLTPTTPRENFIAATFKLARGDTHWPPEVLRRKLVELDYDNEIEVHFPGEFSSRGGIIDLHSPLYEYPVRVEYFGNTIETIRWFAPDTQRSFEAVDSVRIVPRGEAVMRTGREDKENTARFIDYLPPQSVAVFCEPDLIAEHLKRFADAGIQQEWGKAVERLQPRTVAIETSVVDEPHKKTPGDMRQATFPAYSIFEIFAPILPDQQQQENLLRWQLLREALQRWSDQRYKIIACCGNAGEADRFGQLLEEDEKAAALPIERLPIPLSNGIVFPDLKLVFLSEHEIFGKRHETRRKVKPKPWSEQVSDKTPELEEGCHVVHAAHGIAIYLGIREIEAAGVVQEHLELEFADEQRLFVPFDQAHLVTRYIGGTKKLPRLSRIGSALWKRRKEEAASAAYDLAAELLRIEAVRHRAKGTAFSEAREWEHDFSAAFPHRETDDQAEAINAVLDDMAHPEPMDRLLCGDVGYGKTEVAMRAAFRAVMNGKQVAVLVPTTVLAQQHYLTFSDRMAEYPIIIDTISRFRSTAEQREIIEKNALGQIDILIGTHRLLQNDIPFNDLGLVIIDEEQRFGVAHKEKFKQLRTSVDVLTMTATPIPRTLYFSLSGLRNLSTIMTPPAERFPVITHIAQYDNALIRDAILAELERRGQVFFVHNRVMTIAKICSHLMSLVPEARFAIAHGQMEAHELEEIMIQFIEGEIDVLVCTTIIESGLDIPNANTIIIDRADRFGLAELYQLRGRVGRYHNQAYAYLLLPAIGALPRNARERLAAIRQYTHLGAGFKLALRDLEIRGAGNILGAQQSGQIAAVGFELYCELLKEATARLENKKPPRRNVIPLQIENIAFGRADDPKILAAYFPETYIPDQQLRLEYHKRLAELTRENEVDEIKDEMEDRFGAVPQPAMTLLELTRLRIAAVNAGVSNIAVRNGTALLQTSRGYLKTKSNRLPTVNTQPPQKTISELLAICR